MDYKYIEQLLDRYWICETSLEEEEILRMFFSQKDIPVSMWQYRDLFIYEQEERKADVLSDDFDEKILAIVGEDEPKTVRIISLRERLIPLFRAVAIVAIVLTLGNAMQVAFEGQEQVQTIGAVNYDRSEENNSVAKTDTIKLDVNQATTPTPITKE